MKKTMGEIYKTKWKIIDYRDREDDGRLLIQVDVFVDGEWNRTFLDFTQVDFSQKPLIARGENIQIQ